jgi:hypothetical protein
MRETSAPSIGHRLPIEELPQYLTADEMQAYLSIGRSSAYEFARQHGVRIGRPVRVPREALK